MRATLFKLRYTKKRCPDLMQLQALCAAGVLQCSPAEIEPPGRASGSAPVEEVVMGDVPTAEELQPVRVIKGPGQLSAVGTQWRL